MDKLNKDLIEKMAMGMSYPDIMALCNVSTRYNNILDNKIFWLRKLKQDYPHIQDASNPKEMYKYQYESVWVVYSVEANDSEIFGVYKKLDVLEKDITEFFTQEYWDMFDEDEDDRIDPKTLEEQIKLKVENFLDNEEHVYDRYRSLRLSQNWVISK